MKERMIRRWESLTRAQVQSIFESARPEDYAKGGFSDGPYMPPFADELCGRAIRFCFDDREPLEYRFVDRHTLVWCGADGVPHEEYYAAHPSSRAGVYFVQHVIRPSKPPQCRTIIFDETARLVTLCAAHLDNGIEAREVAHEFFFGYLDDGNPPPESRHGFTKDLIGRAIEWTYKHDDFHVKHIYSSEYYYTYAMLRGNGCWMASNPADFVKIADDLYIFTFLEERQVGTQGFFLMDFQKMHDVGSFFGINVERKLECYTVGAKGVFVSPATCFDPPDGLWK